LDSRRELKIALGCCNTRLSVAALWKRRCFDFYRELSQLAWPMSPACFPFIGKDVLPPAVACCPLLLLVASSFSHDYWAAAER
jgi:hypothetical protein